MSTLSVNKILDRAKNVFDAGSDSALARAIGVSPQVVGNWRHRGSMDFAKVVERAHEAGADVRWLLIGEHVEAGVRRMIIRSPGGSAVTVDLDPDCVVMFE